MILLTEPHSMAVTSKKKKNIFVSKLCLFVSLLIHRIAVPNGVSDLHFERPPRWCQLVYFLCKAIGHLFRRQNPQNLQRGWLLWIALLTTFRAWLWRSLLLLQCLWSISGLLLHGCNHGHLVDGNRRDRACPGAPWTEPCEDLCLLAWLQAPGLWCIGWFLGFMGLHI